MCGQESQNRTRELTKHRDAVFGGARKELHLAERHGDMDTGISKTKTARGAIYCRTTTLG
ncbi:hypothetical protein LTR20_009463 [Exophiala xenobiotica]|nr:hypothetical protein LTR40_009856 [Exophiala xenobiotica]KAK5361882.1 hypothetical protein LTS13_009883 [Exophiala xenobiotica]KAK5393303.1 hypothetical protein LTR79_009617 [Exophiala xenobiotica]KAK5408068.1 hypothetical protein LTR90_009524 [Exophiala xenobiotica]KAK5456522.1 hypothetical protein LTR20_009463 [Exophiala xenobiotica]